MRTILVLILSLQSFLSLSAQFLFPSPPPPPQVSLAWDLSTDPRVTGYNLYYGIGSRAYTNQTQVGATNFIAVTLPARGVGTNVITYYFAVTATAPGLESDFSSEASFTPVTRLAPPNLHGPVVITAQAGPVGGPWADVFNVADYPVTNQLYRLQIAQNLTTPIGSLSPQARALNALHAELLKPGVP